MGDPHTRPGCPGWGSALQHGTGSAGSLFQPELGLTKTEVGLFSSAAFAGSWCVLLVTGSAADRFGVRLVMSSACCCPRTPGLGGGHQLGPANRTGHVRSWARARRHLPLLHESDHGLVPVLRSWRAYGPQADGDAGGRLLVAAILPTVALTTGWRSAVGLVGFAIVALGVATAIFYRTLR